MINHATSWRARNVLTIVTAIAISVGGLLWFWIEVEGPLPGVKYSDYQVSLRDPDTKTLLERGQVRIAGVQVGTIASLEPDGDRTRVTVNLDPHARPLHEGVTVHVGLRTALGTSYLNIVDGHGAPIPNGATLPDSAVRESTDFDTLLKSLPPATRDHLASTVRELGVATHGTSTQISQLLRGLGSLGREGFTAVDALAAQSDDLKAITKDSIRLLNSLDTREAQIADVVKNANTLLAATAEESPAVEESVRRLPALLVSARSATSALRDLGGSLTPVAAGLRAGSTEFNASLRQLPGVTRGLRRIFGPLDQNLRELPATLKLTDTLSSDVSDVSPDANLFIRDLNPALAYLAPYGRDIGATTANFGGSIDFKDINGTRPVRLVPFFGIQSIQGNPVPVREPTHWNNPYPKPNTAEHPQPFAGRYPKVERDPN